MSNNNHLKSIPELSLKKNPLGKWASLFIKRFRITILIIITIIIWGSGNYSTIQREAQPKVTIPVAYVRAIYVGASPEEVETLVTEPIEKRLDNLEGVDTISSTSGLGYSTVFVNFETGVDIDEKVREMKEKLSGIESELPTDAETPEVFDMKTGQSPVLIYALSGPQDITQLQQYAEDLQREMEFAYGVKEVSIVGEMDREIQIIIEPGKLTANNISLNDISYALSASNISFPGGNITLNEKEYSVRTSGRFDSLEDIENVVVKTNANGDVLLKDVASVNDTYEERDVFINTGNGQNTLILAVLRKDNADEVQIKESIMSRLEVVQSKVLPKSVSLELMSDKADYVDNQLGSVTDNAVSGLFLVIIVLFLFIGLREALIVSFVIPMSLFAAMGLLNLTGNTLNEITMFSLVLAVGMLVDNAIVVMENIDRLRKQGLPADVASSAATNQIAPAILASTLTTVAAFTPMLFTPGIMGDFIRSIPQTIIITLSCSFFIAITITPSVCAILLKERKKEASARTKKIVKALAVAIVIVLSLFAFADFDQSFPFNFTILSYVAAALFGGGMYYKQFQNKATHNEHPVIEMYSKGLSWIISTTKRKLIFLGSVFMVFLLCVSLPMVGILGVEMFGGEDMPYMSISISTPNGSTVEETKAIAEEVEVILADYPEIKNYVSYIGRDGLSIYNDFDVNSGSIATRASIAINLVDSNERELSSGELSELIRSRIKQIPGAELDVDELESGPPSGAAVYVKLVGKDLDNLEATAKDFESILSTMDGIENPRTSFGDGSPELEVTIDKDKASALGLTEQSVAMSIRSALNGIVSTTYRDGSDNIDVIVQVTEQKLETIHDLSKLTFINNRGVAIPFSQVASVVETESVQGISHEEGKRIVHVAADIDDTVWTSAEATAAFQDAVADYNFPEDVAMSFGGEFETTSESFSDMMLNMILAALLVYIILAVQFNSLSQPFIILFTVPLSIIGVMLGLLITGYNFGFVAFIGVVALVGIAVNDAIVLVDYINYLRSEGYEMKEAIRETGITRFIPVMATTITTAGGILPITLSDPFFAPLGIALISGLCMATVLTLGIVPTMYSLFEGRKIKMKEKRAQKKAESQEEDEAYLELEYEV